MVCMLTWMVIESIRWQVVVYMLAEVMLVLTSMVSHGLHAYLDGDRIN